MEYSFESCVLLIDEINAEPDKKKRKKKVEKASADINAEMTRGLIEVVLRYEELRSKGVLFFDRVFNFLKKSKYVDLKLAKVLYTSIFRILTKGNWQGGLSQNSPIIDLLCSIEETFPELKQIQEKFKKQEMEDKIAREKLSEKHAEELDAPHAASPSHSGFGPMPSKKADKEEDGDDAPPQLSPNVPSDDVQPITPVDGELTGNLRGMESTPSNVNVNTDSSGNESNNTKLSISNASPSISNASMANVSYDSSISQKSNVIIGSMESTAMNTQDKCQYTGNFVSSSISQLIPNPTSLEVSENEAPSVTNEELKTPTNTSPNTKNKISPTYCNRCKILSDMIDQINIRLSNMEASHKILQKDHKNLQNEVSNLNVRVTRLEKALSPIFLRNLIDEILENHKKVAKYGGELRLLALKRLLGQDIHKTFPEKDDKIRLSILKYGSFRDTISSVCDDYGSSQTDIISRNEPYFKMLSRILSSFSRKILYTSWLRRCLSAKSRDSPPYFVIFLVALKYFVDKIKKENWRHLFRDELFLEVMKRRAKVRLEFPEKLFYEKTLVDWKESVPDEANHSYVIRKAHENLRLFPINVTGYAELRQIKGIGENIATRLDAAWKHACETYFQTDEPTLEQIYGPSFMSLQDNSRKTKLLTVKDCWLRQLTVCPMMSAEKAKLLAENFPTFRSLLNFYQQKKSRIERC